MPDPGKLNINQSETSGNVVDEIAGLIKNTFWDNLTRRLDASGIEGAAVDPKDQTKNPRPRIYLPPSSEDQLAYYSRIAKERPKLDLDVVKLPVEGELSSVQVKDLNGIFGLLALEIDHAKSPETGEMELKPVPFVVAGGRFNEMYGWDSYFLSLGLLNDGHPELVKSMVENFMFEVKHYGKILNANRSYYLGRSQPPFLTDMALKTYDAIKHEPGSKDFLKRAIMTAIKEYHDVWMAPPRYDPVTGLSRYGPAGVGLPPEVPPCEYDFLLIPRAREHGMRLEDFIHAYNEMELHDAVCDEFFRHDRAVRESGHDTSHRVENVCADLATIDLNSLLYTYETEIAQTIRTVFDDKLVVPKEFCAHGAEPDHVETSSLWDERAKKRKSLIDKYLWNEEKGMYFDYNTVSKEQTSYEAAPMLWPLWCGVAEPHQASLLVSKGLPKLECSGGIASSSLASGGASDRNHQWDYPYGWPPHQVMAWDGLIKYGFRKEAERCAYRWLRTITSAFVKYNGFVAEKYDVTRLSDPRNIDAGYGNQGDDASAPKRSG